MKTPNRRNLRGFSLLELVLVLAIVAVLVGLLLPKGFDALRNARVQQVAQTVKTLKTALVQFISMPGGSGSLPRTEGTGIPCSGAALSGATDIAKGNAARLDAVLLTAGKLEGPLSLRMGSQAFVSSGAGNEIAWNQASQTFQMPRRNATGPAPPAWKHVHPPRARSRPSRSAPISGSTA